MAKAKCQLLKGGGAPSHCGGGRGRQSGLSIQGYKSPLQPPSLGALTLVSLGSKGTNLWCGPGRRGSPASTGNKTTGSKNPIMRMGMTPGKDKLQPEPNPATKPHGTNVSRDRNSLQHMFIRSFSHSSWGHGRAYPHQITSLSRVNFCTGKFFKANQNQLKALRN